MYRYSVPCLAFLIACDEDKTLAVYNSTPQVSIISHEDGTTFSVGQQVEFQASVSDANDAETDLETQWINDNGELCAWTQSDSSGLSTCTVTLTETDNKITVMVRDPGNAVESDSLEFSVLSAPENTAPECTIMEPQNNSSAPVGTMVTFTGVISDAETVVTDLIVEFSSNLDLSLGTVPSDSNGLVMFPYADLTIGSHLISMTVSDEEGAECVANIVYTVEDCPDSDSDGVCDSDDVCNGGDDNVDTDGDGNPDFCDPCPNDFNDDTDGDGICDSDDLCEGSDDNVDTDGDGNPDGCDPCPNDFNDDTDGDGICDSEDICEGGDDSVDSDGDGTPDFCDGCPGDSGNDSDGDGVCDDADICDGGDDTVDTDGDGTPDFCDDCPNDALDDSDGDGVCDSDDVCNGGDDNVDTDGDGNPDDCDPCPDDILDDSDGDGVCDSDDICNGGDDNVDTDFNGIPDDCEATGGILLTDSASNTIYLLDETGFVVNQYSSPVSNPRGITFDRSGDGFWVSSGDWMDGLYHVDWAGNTTILTFGSSFPSTPYDLYGLDHHYDPAGGIDNLVPIGINVNSITVVWAVDIATGNRQIESSHYQGGFQNDFWGIHVTGVGSSDIIRWSSWTAGRLEWWASSVVQTQVIHLPFSSVKGMTLTPDGDFWVVGGTTIYKLDANGNVVDSFAAPGSSPAGISYY